MLIGTESLCVSDPLLSPIFEYLCPQVRASLSFSRKSTLSLCPGAGTEESLCGCVGWGRACGMSHFQTFIQFCYFLSAPGSCLCGTRDLQALSSMQVCRLSQLIAHQYPFLLSYLLLTPTLTIHLPKFVEIYFLGLCVFCGSIILLLMRRGGVEIGHSTASRQKSNLVGFK